MDVVAAIVFFWLNRLNPAIYKNLVKNRKTGFLRQAIQEPTFSVANIIQILKAVAMGVVAVCGTFLVR